LIDRIKIVILLALLNLAIISGVNMTLASDTLKTEEIQIEGYEKVLKVEDPKSGLQALIAVHNTALGPALGGIRIYPYAGWKDALTDVLRLSKGMTFKSALAETGLGGGKSVIIADPKKDKTEDLLEAFGLAVDQLDGLYICAEDVGCTAEDVKIIRRKTQYVTGLEHDSSSGDPSPYTAWGTFIGLQTTWNFLSGTAALDGVSVAVQGLGSVGMKLTEQLYWAGAKVIVADVDPAKTAYVKKKFGFDSVHVADIYDVPCDIFAPCAMGGILNENTISRLKCVAIAGCANNQLLEDQDDFRLMERGILYAPDFVINAGGIMNVSVEVSVNGYNPQEARKIVQKIPERLVSIYNFAKQGKTPTQQAAIALAEHRLKYGIGKRTQRAYFHHQ
jgi:leucine dehydrogenase